jgi:hypothetical protein
VTFLPTYHITTRWVDPDSAVEREVMSKEQTFRSEEMPFGIANRNLKFQNMESSICDVKIRVLARTSSRFAPSSLFNCGIWVDRALFVVR